MPARHMLWLHPIQLATDMLAQTLRCSSTLGPLLTQEPGLKAFWELDSRARSQRAVPRRCACELSCDTCDRPVAPPKRRRPSAMRAAPACWAPGAVRSTSASQMSNISLGVWPACRRTVSAANNKCLRCINGTVARGMTQHRGLHNCRRTAVHAAEASSYTRAARVRYHPAQCVT